QLGEKSKQAAEAAKKASEAAKAKNEDQNLDKAAADADAEAKRVEELRKQADARKKQIDTDLKNAQNAAKAKDVNLNVVSTAWRVRVAATPLTVSATAPGAKKQGETFEIPVKIERKYGYEDPVEVTLEAPGGVAGATAGKLTIDKGQAEGKLEVKLADTATVGDHQFNIRFRSRYNNVQMDDLQSIPIGIAAK
ncbi:MAG: hypothetical protein KDA41_02615, partial [Planctomycetales bacterium]|nr:hypothetical protein [Planctomycetales bacterium]